MPQFRPWSLCALLTCVNAWDNWKISKLEFALILAPGM